MPFVIYVAPFFQDWAVREMRAFADVRDVRLAVVGQDPWESLPQDVQERIVGHWRVDDALHPDQLVWAASELSGRHGQIDRLITAQEHTQMAVAVARDVLGVPGMSASQTRNFRDKARMKELFRAAGLPCARHSLVDSDAWAWRFIDEVGFPVVVKPPAGAGTVTTFRAVDPDAFRAALNMLPPSADSPVLLEEFLIGTEHSFETYSVDGRHVWHSLTDYLPSPLKVMEHPWMQMCGLLPREIDEPRYDDIRAAAYRALNVLGMDTGVTHMEWFRRPDGSVAISEVAARPPGGELMTFMSRAHDFDSVRAWAHLMVHGEFKPPRERKYAVACAYLRAQGEGDRIVAVEGLDRVFEEVGTLVTDQRIPQLGQVPKRHYSGDGYIILRHPETQVARDAIMRVVETVRVYAG